MSHDRLFRPVLDDVAAARVDALNSMANLLIHDVGELLGRPMTPDEAARIFGPEAEGFVSLLNVLGSLSEVRLMRVIRASFRDSDSRSDLILVEGSALDCANDSRHVHVPLIPVHTTLEPGVGVAKIEAVRSMPGQLPS